MVSARASRVPRFAPTLHGSPLARPCRTWAGVVVVLTLASFAGGCGARTGLPIPEPEIDAAPEDAATDAAMEVDAGPPPLCPEGEECDCFAEGSVRWGSVGYGTTCGGKLYAQTRDPRGRVEASSGWGTRLVVEASCEGRYEVCAQVRGRGEDGCTVIDELCTSGTIGREGETVMPPPPSWTMSSACSERVVFGTGAHTCLTIRWTTTTGRRGSTKLGCFAEIGPFGRCTGKPTGEYMEPPGEHGEWEF